MSRLEKLNPGHACVFEFVIGRAHRSVTGREEAELTVCPLPSVFACFLTILFHRLNAQREWKWEACEATRISCLFCFLLLTDFISMVDSAWAAWPGWHDWRFEPNPSALFWLWWRWRDLLSVCVCVREREGQSVKWYCWDVRASPDALVPYNIPIPFLQTDAAIQGECNPDFSLQTQYLHHTNGQWGGMDGMWYGPGIWPFLLIPLSHIDVWAFHCSAKNEVFQSCSHWQI